MAQNYAISPVVEGGGVLLPSVSSMGGDYVIGTSSSSSSDSAISEPPTHSASQSLVDSDSSSPSLTSDLHQHGSSDIGPIVSANANVVEEGNADADDFAQAHSPMVGIVVPSEESVSPAGNVDDDQSASDPNIMHIIGPSNDPDAEPMDITATGNDGHPDPSASGVNVEVVDDSPPTPTPLPEVTFLNICNQFHYISDNPDVEQFLHNWRLLWLHRNTEFPYISEDGGSYDIRHRRGRVSVKSMEKASCDMQGINWSQFETTKSQAREMRRRTTKNFINMPEINDEQRPEAYATPKFKARFVSDTSPPLSHTQDFFRFREMNLKLPPTFAHNQLRHCVSAGSKNAVFFYDRSSRGVTSMLYPYFHQHISKIRCFNPEAEKVSEVIDLKKRRRPEFFRSLKIACVHAAHDLLVVGSLREGHYAMKSLSNTCDSSYVQGFLSDSNSGGMNHVHTFLHRHSGVPHAVFCDNEAYIRVVDCNTTQLVQAQRWDSFVNCSATSPDGGLRIHVSDDPWPIVAEAETGRIVARLTGHKDHGFACDWSPDGITMATGHQDGKVQVWDARKMNKAVHVLPAEMGGIRSLQFSPLGSGHPVLVMAEPVDFVSIVDARTFQSKQDIEFLGEIAGASMPPDGNTLFVGNADPRFGGIMEFERTGYIGEFKHRKIQCSNLQQRKNQRRQAVYNASPDESDCEDLVEEPAPEAKLERKWKVDDQDAMIWQTRQHDWTVDADMNSDRRVVLSRKQRWQRHLGLENIMF